MASQLVRKLARRMMKAQDWADCCREIDAFQDSTYGRIPVEERIEAIACLWVVARKWDHRLVKDSALRAIVKIVDSSMIYQKGSAEALIVAMIDGTVASEAKKGGCDGRSAVDCRR